MPQKPKPDTVTLTHPSGAFEVHVTPARAVELASRGYTYTDGAPPDDPRTVAELRAELKSRGLDTAGRKAELVARLAEAGE